MKHNFIYVLLFVSIFYLDGFACSIGQEQSFIKEIVSFKEAEESLKKADRDTLVLFDVDDTLIVHRYKPFWEKNKQWFDKVSHSIFKNQYAWRQSFWIIKQTSVPLHTEEDIVQRISDLQRRNVSVLALTSIHTRQVCNKYVEVEWRYKKLKECGIDFTHTDFPDRIFHEFKIDWRTSRPLLFKGMLCTGCNPKGNVLETFLSSCTMNPKKIIFFDDKLENIKSVEDQIKLRNISNNDSILYEGYHYRGAEQMDPSFDEDVVSFQLGYVAATDIWLDDAEAKKLLESESCAQEDIDDI